METKQYTLAEKIKALKSAEDQWIVVVVNGRVWFSDGRIIVACAEEPNEEHVWSVGGWGAKKWKDGIDHNITATPKGYVRGIAGDLRGAFGVGYVRPLAVPDSTLTVYVQERYLRTVEGDCEILLHSEAQPVYFVRDGAVVAVLMPMRAKPKQPKDGFLDLAALPLVPFLEDAMCFHECPDEEE